MAMKHLFKSELRDLGVMTAAELWNRLQAMYKKGTIGELNDGLNPLDSEEPRENTRQSIFHSLTSPRDAEMAFDVGFRSIDEPDQEGVTPILYSVLHRSHPLRAYEENLIYADWLIEKGAKLEYSINSLKLSAIHNLARVSAWWARACMVQGSASDRIPRGVYRVLSAVCCSKVQCRLPCPCSPGDLSRPVHQFFSTALDSLVDPGCHSYHGKPFNSYPKTIHLAVYLADLLHRLAPSLDMTYVAKSIIHLLTMDSLGVQHLKWCHESAGLSEERVQQISKKHGWEEMLDKDQSAIDKLEELTEKFKEEFLAQKVSLHDFLQNHWLEKMLEEQKKRKPLSDEDKQRLEEIGVKLASGYESSSDRYDSDFYFDCDDHDEEDDDDDEEHEEDEEYEYKTGQEEGKEEEENLILPTRAK